MKQIKWIDRDFKFDATQNIFPSIIERLLGTPIRLKEKLKSIPLQLLIERINNTWTIKENVGHLIDSEPLWQGRLEDIISGQKELRPADLQNNTTHSANHNETPMNELVASFRQVRRQTVLLLEEIDEESIFKFALHPRLKTPMRTMDLFLFVAEHDDHHLARISEIIKTINGR